MANIPAALLTFTARRKAVLYLKVNRFLNIYPLRDYLISFKLISKRYLIFFNEIHYNKSTETPQRTTTTTTTTTSTTTTIRPTTTRTTTTRPPRKQPKKQHERTNLHNVIDPDVRQAELNNALNYYNNAHGAGANSSYNEYAQRTERQKVRPSGPPRHYVVYSVACDLRGRLISFWVLIILVKNFNSI